MRKSVPQGLKPSRVGLVTARLKPCPDTKHQSGDSHKIRALSRFEAIGSFSNIEAPNRGLTSQEMSSHIGLGKGDCWASPGFPVDLVGVGELHAAFLIESRTRGRWWRPVAGNPGRPSFSAHVRFGER